MKCQKILGLVATAGLLLAGCATDSDNNNTWLSDSNAVHVSASVGSIFTRSNPAASDEAGQKSFNNGDVMGVSNNGKSLNYTFNGTDWQPGNGSYLVWDKSDLKFQCWYPADGKNSFSKGYIQEDQSDAEKIAKSDYMTAEKKLDAIPDNRKLEVAMERKTARLIFNIKSFNDQFTADTKVNHVRIVGKECTDANETSTINIKPLQKGEGGINTTYTALVAPGKVDGKLYFSTDESAETPLVVKTGTLVAGNSYTYNLIVGKNKIAINDITVKEWTTGEITGGKAEEAKTPYLTFTAGGEQTFEMRTRYIDPEIMPGYEPYKISGLQYSLNNGDWKDVGATGIRVTFGGNNGTLRLRGKNLKGTAKSESEYSYISFGDNKVPVTCTGDIRTLLDHDSYKTVATDQARFCRLFMNCSAMTTAPNLPAETLADKCYREMFSNCKNLVKAPELPAKILAADCYCGMFDGCTKLETAPNLQAINLAESCYSTMFRSCESLETAPALPAENLASSCYSFMFYGCTKLKSAPDLPAKNVASSCYSYMFYGCTSLVKALDLPAINMEENCYDNMFAGCKSLESAPKLPATKLAERCYDNMFYGCEKLSSVTMLAPSDQIEDIFYSFNSWLNDAGTSAATRTLKVKNADAYNALANNEYYLPSNSKWIKGTSGTTVKDENNIDIQ